MADVITPLLDILTCLCGYCSKWADSIRQLGDSLNSLENASSQLNDMYLDVKMRVETAQQDPDPALMVLNEVRGWMGRVEVLQNEIQAILQQGDEEIQAKCYGGRCPKNCRASYKLQKMVTQKLSEVNNLTSQGHFDVVAEKFARDQFDELPVDKVMGVESTFEELCSCFENNQMGIIGLYGMGGVGKTTLLKKFNNDFLSKKVSNVVIWVVASKDADPQSIQDAIRKKLCVQDYIWSNKTMHERALLLYNVLIKKKFVLLLDDVWERVDMLKLGVPSPKNHECKIIFTTRLEEVCGLMDAQRCIKVDCLAPDKAFELFKEKMGEATLESPHILPLAKQVVDECQGLPLALCTVGRAMANKITPNEWNTGIEVFPTEVFVLPSTLRVIDLSSNFGIKNLPSTIGDFVNLEHMNLSNTYITKLLEELKNLKKLRFLLLDKLAKLEIPGEIISSLLSLQAFSMRGSEVQGIDENVLLNELEGLDNLQDIRIFVFSTSSIEKILISSKLQRRICELSVVGVNLPVHDLFLSLGKMEHLEILQVQEHREQEESEAVDIPRRSFWVHDYIITLCELHIGWFPNNLDLNWLIRVPNLQVLEVFHCDSLVEVISEDFGTADTERVKMATQKVAAQTRHSFVTAETRHSASPLKADEFATRVIEVTHCPSLKKLPFNSQSALKNLKCFRGESKWLDQLEWQDEATKRLISSKLESGDPLEGTFKRIVREELRLATRWYPLVNN
ncbi:probable disease resistance protein At4g14610 [Neltuma alba]|uniref:probable disease resistance protein At4g14610 n=1 Tax=Neltuma alba TaxID=207710 RepID=UPI0010A471A8|nr:probable disease resistance protein At4g14610 [Prosopis alba]